MFARSCHVLVARSIVKFTRSIAKSLAIIVEPTVASESPPLCSGFDVYSL